MLNGPWIEETHDEDSEKPEEFNNVSFSDGGNFGNNPTEYEIF